MKHNPNPNPQWFTLLLILGVVWFLLILLTWIYKVVLFELHDTRDMSHFMKSRTASESWWEIAMLKLKENGFWYHADGIYDTNNISWESIILAEFPLDTSQFNPNRDVFLGYEIDSKSQNYSWKIQPWDFQIIPLFYTGDIGSVGNTKEPKFEIITWTADDLVWNIIWTVWGVSWIWAFDGTTSVNLKELSDDTFSTWDWWSNKWFTLTNTTVTDFLNEWQLLDKNYLTIYNVGDSLIAYNVTTWDGESFTKPITTVYSSAKIGDIKQNIELEIDNSKYFDVLKYAIYDY